MNLTPSPLSTPGGVESPELDRAPAAAPSEDRLEMLLATLQAQAAELQQMHGRLMRMEEALHRFALPAQLASLSPHLRRNMLPNDDAASHKMLMQLWRSQASTRIGQAQLLESGFRVFSQNDEDGILLRIFSQIGTTNQYVVEIGSNCSGSDLGFPENLSTNLIVHHGWHGAILEIDEIECQRIRHFFAVNYTTRHFHAENVGHGGYFSPVVLQAEITPENVDEILKTAHHVSEPDLFIIDIDGGDHAVVERITAIRPRVMVVEFEKRFRDRHAVVQRDRAEFSRRWAQSGSVSLMAWEKLLIPRGYRLCAIGTCGFNAFYVRDDVADGRLDQITPTRAFDAHPILGNAPETLWLDPDDTWTPV